MNTIYFMNQIMGNVFRTKTSPAIPTEYWIGLCTSAPTVEGLYLGEINFENTGYKRVDISKKLSVPEDGVITNTELITFDESISDWGVITHYAVFDANEAGNLLFFGELNASRVVEMNTIVIVRPGELTVQLANP